MSFLFDKLTSNIFLFYQQQPLFHPVLKKYIEYSCNYDLETKLFSCHRSFLVNLDNISRIDKSQLMIYFENGDSCPVSRLKMKALLKKWSEVKEH